MMVSPHAGKRLPQSLLVDVSRLTQAYYDNQPNILVPEQCVIFGTSGHRGSALDTSFNEWHVLAITQAVCQYRLHNGIRGPMFLGMDTHALSALAFRSVLEVLAANDVEVMIAEDGDYTPTPAISHAILSHNGGRRSLLADGLVITPSHNPPQDGGVKYNPPHGGPADALVSIWIESRANEILEKGLSSLRRMSFEAALRKDTTRRCDFVTPYVEDLGSVIDLEVIRDSNLHLGVDPLGGAGIRYWQRIAERHGLRLTLVSDKVDPTFSFLTADRDGELRMDPSSEFAMQPLIALRDRFDIAVACDADHDRHGVVTPAAGLMPSNHYLAAAANYLFEHRPRWSRRAAIGKSVVTSQMLDRVAARLGRECREVPVGFKWFVAGLLDGELAFCGEESAGAAFARMDGSVWTTDKDGIIAGLLAAEMTARCESDPSELYAELTRELGAPVYTRLEAPATLRDKARLRQVTQQNVTATHLAGEPIRSIETRAPAGGAPIGGLRIKADSGWFAVRPSGTESLYKIYAESFQGDEHLHRILDDAREIIGSAVAASGAEVADEEVLTGATAS